MSDKLCPYCGREPIPTGAGAKVMCNNLKCPIYAREFSPGQWNRRFVCPDKNGDNVYSDDKVKYVPEGLKGRYYICRVVELREPRYGYGLVGDDDFFRFAFYPAEIELIKEPDK